MILTEIQDFIGKSQQVSLADMKLHFHMDEGTLRPMLKKLVRKGRIRQLPIAKKCDCCTSCHSDTLELYEWVGMSKSSI
ncbi:MAG: FeoC-like transcriptional regulator [Hydrococcus sp. Prado102]|nr:FeoC-like transcriptional regulator [Hydrococcus sp. Prado102]